MEPALLQHVLNVSLQLAETRTLQPLLEDALAEALQLVGAERGYIVLQRNDGTLDFKAQRTASGTHINDANDQVSHSVLARVIDGGKPLVLRDALTNPEFSMHESVIALQLRSIMCVPLITRGNTLGAMYVENRSVQGRFTQRDLPPLTLFANQAAVSIENAALNEQLEARVASRTRELRRAMAEAEQAWAQSLEANRLRTVIITRITHDLRDPLTVILNALGLLLSGHKESLDPEQTHWITQSLEAAERIQQLSADLFGLSNLRVGGLILELQRVSLKQELSQVYDIAKDLPWPAGTTFDADLADDLPPIAIDTARIRQVLLNLLTNAMRRVDKHPEGGKVTLHARVPPGRRTVEIGVADNGTPLNSAERNNMFERYGGIQPESYLNDSHSTLAISKDLVELHGGQIWAEDSAGGGANIVFTLLLVAEDMTEERTRYVPDEG